MIGACSAVRSRATSSLLAPLRNGVTLVTLAPEQVPEGFIAQLAGAGVRVSLGHSMATYAQTRAALSEGLTGFTHLFNAMRPLASREPGPIAAALEEPGAWFGMIVDGEHVAPAMLRLALRGAGKAMLVTDAMPPVGGSSTSFRLYGQRITVRDGRCTTADGTLAGSVLDMASAVRNCVRMLDLPLAEALPLATTAPAAFLGIDGWLGRLAPGYRADLVALDPDTIDVFATWVAGKPSVTRMTGPGCGEILLGQGGHLAGDDARAGCAARTARSPRRPARTGRGHRARRQSCRSGSWPSRRASGRRTRRDCRAS